VLSLPAYQWLLSEHDIAVDNVQRYTASGIRRRLAAVGFTAIRTSYWNTLLFPLMVLRRKLGRRSTGKPESEVALMPAPVEALFRAMIQGEAMVASLGISLPFGGSVLATAVKP